MVLVPRQRGWNTYSYPPTNPWAGHYTVTPGSPAAASWFSEHLASQAAHAHTFPSPGTSTTLTVPATTTDSPTQVSTPPAALGLQTTPTASPTTSLLSLPGETTSPLVTPSPAESSSFRLTLTFPLSIPSGGGLTVSLPDAGSGSGSAAQPDPTAPSSSSSSGETTQPVATGSSSSAGPNPNSSSNSSRIGKGEIAAIVLGLMFALGLCALAYFLWKRRKGRGRDSTFIQYPFSSTSPTSSTPPRPLVPPNTPADRPWSDAHTDTDGRIRSPSPATTLTLTAFGGASPTGASGYGGGLAVYPLDEKSALSSPSHDGFYSATEGETETTPGPRPSPRGTTAFATSFAPPPPSESPSPGSGSPPAPLDLPAHAHVPQPQGHRDPDPGPPPFILPYAWDRPPPSSEYLPRTPDRRSTFRSSRGASASASRRASAGTVGTVGATPKYSSGVPEADRRPPEYSRY